MNEDVNQAGIADQMQDAARKLAHSTRAVPSPPDSYELLGDLRATANHLEQVATQLASWHDNAEEGVENNGEDGSGDGAATATAAGELSQAAACLSDAAEHLSAAHSANSVVRWIPRRTAHE